MYFENIEHLERAFIYTETSTVVYDDACNKQKVGKTF